MVAGMSLGGAGSSGAVDALTAVGVPPADAVTALPRAAAADEELAGPFPPEPEQATSTKHATTESALMARMVVPSADRS